MLALLRGFPPLEWGQGETVVGLGLPLNPTPHRFEVHGRQLYTWCALDALIIPRLLGVEARVESPCPATGTSIRVWLAPEHVLRYEPETSVVSVVPLDGAENVRAAFCEQVHFFRSAEDAAPWLARHLGAQVVSVPTGLELGWALWQQLGQSPRQSRE